MNSIFNDFLTTCSGANKSILKRCPTEHTKFAGIGATIFLTAVMAMISGGYAINFVFDNISISICFGIFWGIVIFNLDRYIVSSIKKTGVFKEEFLFALPRILIALILAISISKPLELRLFENRIAKQLDKNNKVYVNNYDEHYKTDIENLKAQQKNLDDELITKKQDIYAKDPQYSKLKDTKDLLDKKKKDVAVTIINNIAIIRKNYYLKTFHYSNDSTYIRNIPNQTALNKMAENRSLGTEQTDIENQLTDLTKQITNREQELGETVKNIGSETERTKNSLTEQIKILTSDYIKNRPGVIIVAQKSTDLLARLEGLGDLASFGSTVWWTSLTITTLFILLETAPVTVKLLSKRGPYDEILDRVEYENYIHQKKLISETNDSVNTLIKISTDKNKRKLDAELRANEEVLNSVVIAQTEIAKLAIEKWKQGELTKLNNGENNIIFASNIQNSTLPYNDLSGGLSG